MISFWRVLKFGFLNFWRNSWLSLATTLIFALTLFIISAFFFINLLTNRTTQIIQDKMDILVTFREEAKDEEIFNLQEQLNQLSVVKSVKYISKEEAMQIWQQLPLSEDVKNLVTSESNPLPRSLQIKANSPDDLDKIAEFLSIKKWQSIIRKGGISYQKNKRVLDRLNNVTKLMKKIDLILAVIFLAISFLVIFNTLRLNIMSRRDEIEIQRLVGATNFFIAGPFLVEGVLYGLLATIISTILLYSVIHFTTPLVAKYLSETTLNLKNYFLTNLIAIFVIQFFIGVFIGSICSLITVKKYLKI
jgi:cell division transport system permease protein